MTDSECIRRCLDGQPEHYRLLVERYEKPLAALLRGRSADRRWLDDALQESFFRAYRLLGRIRADEPFFPWLAGVGLHVAQELQKAQRRAARPRVQPPPAVLPAADDGDAERDAELLRAVQQLGQPYRDVVLLRYYGAWSCAEVAELLSLPIGTVTKRLSRAHALLHEILKPLLRPQRAEVQR